MTYQNGVKISLSSPLIIPPIRQILQQGVYEKKELEVITRTIKPHDNVLEVGAGIGYIACHIVTRLSSFQNYLAVEADPQVFQLLKYNLALNNLSIKALQAVLTNHRGQIQFYRHPYFTSSTTISIPDSKYFFVPAYNKHRLMMQVRPTYLIIDIEGGEIDFLQGLNLTSVRTICVECHPQIVGQRATNQMKTGLKKAGFIYVPRLSLGSVLLFTRPY